MKQKTARISAVHKDQFSIIGEHGEINAELTGKLAYLTASSLDFPVVGDMIHVQYLNQNTLAIIQDVLPRKSILKRKAAGKITDYQTMAANIDTGFIMQSLDRDFNLNRLERYLVMLIECRIEPIILLSKSDLMTEPEIRKQIKSIVERLPNLQIIAFSNYTKSGLAEIKDLLQKDQTYCLLGSSGVGKTTLINYLIGEEKYTVREVREKDSRGKHTTSRRQLLLLQNGAYLIDTPGMRELGQIEIETGLRDTFEDIALLALKCKFADCTHTNESGCAVQKSLTEGILSEKQYLNYIKLKKESTYNKMTYLEKRTKDKEFGKMVKRVMKDKTKYQKK
ncbi:ribosome small subunit-dependent GTPase A [Candidatus Margulisiibacteriota bacterium]